MNYEHLFAFVVFAEHSSFTHAAKALHISQPALHVQIKKLSEAVGFPLYRRSGRSLVLTAEGRSLATFGREIESEGRNVLSSLRGEPESGPVVLASGQGAFLYLLGRAIKRFPKKTWPLRLLTMNAHDAVEAVRDARAHIAVVALDEAPDGLFATKLRTVGQHVILRASHPLAKRRMLRVRDLAAEPLIVAPSGVPHRTMLTQLFSAHGEVLDVAVEATGWTLMLTFAQHGMGAAVVNDFCPAPKGMVAVPLEGAPRIAYYLVTRRSRRSEGREALRALIEETVR